MTSERFKFAVVSVLVTMMTAYGFVPRQQPDQPHTPSPSAPVVEVLIQDNLVPAVNNEIEGLRNMIRSLPPGSRVLTAYITSGSLAVTQDFTSDRARAAASLRVLRGAGRSFFAPEIGFDGPNRVGSLLGSGSLKRLANETGGRTYGGGMSVVNFSSYIRDFRNSLGAR